MKKILLLAILFPLFVWAQDDECGYDSLYLYTNTDKTIALTQPWTGNNQLLEDVLGNNNYNQLVSQSTALGCNLAKFVVPVDIIVWRTDAGGNDFTDARINAVFRETNRLYATNNTGIQFYIRNIFRRENTNFSSDARTNAEVAAMFLLFSSSSAINVHIVHHGFGSNGSALTPFQSPQQYKLCIRTTADNQAGTPVGITNNEIANTLSHELGHTLGLLHTHDPGRVLSSVLTPRNGGIINTCYQEVASRTYVNPRLCDYTDELSSEINGDFLSDTPADPCLRINRVTFVAVNNNICSFDANLTPSDDYVHDNLDAPWTPDVNNIMSYSRRDACRTTFSRLQTAVMWYYLINDFFKTRQNLTTISGIDLICSGSPVTLSAPSLNNASYVWTASSNLIINSQTNNSVQLQAAAYASSIGTVNVQITLPYGNFCLSKNVSVGTSGMGEIKGPVDLKIGQSVSYYISDTKQANLFNWTIPTGCYNNYCWKINSGQGTNRIYVTVGSGTGAIKCTATNLCGTYTRSLYVNVPPPGGGGGGGSDPCSNAMLLKVSPSPNNGKNVIAQVVYPPDPCDALYRTNHPLSTISIIDSNNTIMYSQPYDGKRMNMKGLSLTSGKYIVRYKDDATVLENNLLIDCNFAGGSPFLITHAKSRKHVEIDYIDNSNIVSPYQIQLLDLSGLMYFNAQTSEHEYKVDVSNLKTGVYNLRLSYQNTITDQQIVIE